MSSPLRRRGRPAATVDEQISHGLAVASEPCPGLGLESSVVTRAQAQAEDEPWRFVVHVTTAPAGPRTVCGVEHPGDPDLLMHFAVSCAAGIAISGPPPATVLRTPSRRSVLAYLVGELDDALDGPFAYAVLNACRAWRYLDTGDLVSKVTGGSWVVQRVPAPVVRRALDEQRGGSGSAPCWTRASAVRRERPRPNRRRP